MVGTLGNCWSRFVAGSQVEKVKSTGDKSLRAL